MDTTMRTTLLDMPIEIIDAIIDKLPRAELNDVQCRRDIKQFRLVCTNIESKTRRRFAQECFSSLLPTLTRGGFDNAHHIMDDDTFRNNVRGIELNFARNVVEEHGPNNEIEATGDLDAGYVMDGTFKSDFLALLNRFHEVGKVCITSPLLPIHDTEDLDEVMNRGWRKLALDALAAIATCKTIHLKEFALGRNEGLPITVQDLASISEASITFSELTRLSLYGILENASGESPTILADLLASAPKLAKLDFQGDVVDYVKLDYIPINLTHLPPITELRLSKFFVTEESLLKGLELLGETLHILSMETVELCTGTWRTIFGSMRKTLRLSFLALGDLSRGYGEHETDDVDHIFFTNTLRDRPVVLDFKLGGSVGTIWHDAIWMWHDAIWTRMEIGKLNRALYEEEIKDIDEMIANDWVWAAHHFDHQGCVVLDEEEGDDVMAWLAMVDEQHVVN
jgi:hypothetical protein